MNKLPAAVLSLGLGAGAAVGIYEFGQALNTPNEQSSVADCAQNLQNLGSAAININDWVSNCESYAPGSVEGFSATVDGHTTLAYALPAESEFLAKALPAAKIEDEGQKHLDIAYASMMGVITIGVTNWMYKPRNKHGNDPKARAAYQQALKEVWRM